MNIRAAADIAAKERQVVVKWIKRCLRESPRQPMNYQWTTPRRAMTSRSRLKGPAIAPLPAQKESPSISCLFESSKPTYWNIQPLRRIK